MKSMIFSYFEFVIELPSASLMPVSYLTKVITTISLETLTAKASDTILFESSAISSLIGLTTDCCFFLANQCTKKPEGKLSSGFLCWIE